MPTETGMHNEIQEYEKVNKEMFERAKEYAEEKGFIQREKTLQDGTTVETSWGVTGSGLDFKDFEWMLVYEWTDNETGSLESAKQIFSEDDLEEMNRKFDELK